MFCTSYFTPIINFIKINDPFITKETNDHTLQSLTSLFQSIQISNTPQTPNNPIKAFQHPTFNSSSPNSQDPLKVQIKTHFLLTLLSQVLQQMNSQFANSEDLILQNLRTLVVDSPDCLFLVEKLFDPTESQVGALMRENLLTEVFNLRGRLAATLSQLADSGLVAKNHPTFSLI